MFKSFRTSIKLFLLTLLFAPVIIFFNSCSLVSGTLATYATDKGEFVFMFGYLSGSIKGTPAALEKATITAFKDNAIKKTLASSNEKGAAVKGITGEGSDVSVYITKTDKEFCDVQISVGILGNENMSKNIFYAMQNEVVN